MIGKYKKFSKADHKQYDPFGRLIVKKYLTVLGFRVKDNPDEYGPDLEVNRPGQQKWWAECEVRPKWITPMFPYKTVHVPERKGKFLCYPHFVYFAIRADGKRLLYTTASVIEQYPRRESPNDRIAAGEYFYDVPLKLWTMRRVPSLYELIQ
jgi:hypothetical protein